MTKNKDRNIKPYPKLYSASMFDAPIGTIVNVAWPDVTSWCHSGWALKEAKPGYAVLKRVKMY